MVPGRENGNSAPPHGLFETHFPGFPARHQTPKGWPTAKAKPIGMPKTTPPGALGEIALSPRYSAADVCRTPSWQPIYQGYQCNRKPERAVVAKEVSPEATTATDSPQCSRPPESSGTKGTDSRPRANRAAQRAPLDHEEPISSRWPARCRLTMRLWRGEPGIEPESWTFHVYSFECQKLKFGTGVAQHPVSYPMWHRCPPKRVTPYLSGHPLQSHERYRFMSRILLAVTSIRHDV